MAVTMKKRFQILTLLVCLAVSLQAADFLLEVETQSSAVPRNVGYDAGRQSLPVAAGDYVFVHIYAASVSQMDGYEFSLRWSPVELQWLYFDAETDAESNLFAQPLLLQAGKEDSLAIAVTGAGAGSEQTTAEGYLGVAAFQAKIDYPRGVELQNVAYADAAGESIALNQIDSEATFGGGSLPVDMQTFQAESTPAGVRLQWQTEHEMNVLGFQVWRQSGQTDLKPLHHDTMRAMGDHRSHFYTFVDSTAQPRRLYEYVLFEIMRDGRRERYGPLQHTHQPPLPGDGMQLLRNYPNPFNAQTTIPFVLESEGIVRLQIFNIRGETVRTYQFKLSSGLHEVVWDGTDGRTPAPAGVYLLQLQQQKTVKINKCMILP